MRNRFAIAICLVAASVGAFAGDASSELKRHIESGFASFATAFKTKDIKSLERVMRGYFAKNYVSTDKSGKKMGLEAVIKLQKQHLASIKSIKMLDLKLSKVHATGNKGRALETLLLTAEAIDPERPGKTASLKVVAAEDSQYRRMGGKWICVRSKSITEMVWINGKLMPAGAM